MQVTKVAFLFSCVKLMFVRKVQPLSNLNIDDLMLWNLTNNKISLRTHSENLAAFYCGRSYTDLSLWLLIPLLLMFWLLVPLSRINLALCAHGSHKCITLSARWHRLVPARILNHPLCLNFWVLQLQYDIKINEIDVHGSSLRIYSQCKNLLGY